MKLTILTMIVLLWNAGCGVKGDPLPPEQSAKIGTGRPEKRSSRGFEEVQKTSPQELDYDADESETN